ncbi:hypothetical protein KXX33_006967 [Aspergillus fumigatus]|uniref:Fatty acid desaturase domain-containing protein n=2 Tax=Aspergillus fumigatus TaxID=746128 RepID=Q4WFK5_ASPFU|nr:conserved hypothetical protein [Aspergillus fumigatus Af293]KAH1367433.1 hypothetical protein KXX33_006967 [Aspergillus fumigatus]EAL86472.2 conserved hypothetical protein [Aspergillus fumigatus Af293]KAH1371524.1 hypothetical protein KXX14_003070 [Aspergillus fumigatus]KAH1389976.1 hypothetical protein KXX10_008644 [Aspergillus fumigatus]KAH1392438.1 hypothetical protein KXX50_000763 [Aspergillus fumigatus]
MEPDSYIDPNLTRSDLLVLQTLLSDAQAQSTGSKPVTLKYVPSHHNSQCKSVPEQLEAFNNPQHADFEPTVTMTWDTADLKAKLPSAVNQCLLQPYIQLGRRVVRVETDVVMLTHLILYFTTSVPSALYLHYHFTWTHGVLHWIMQSYYVGTYTLMMHQHIHMGGILAKRFWLVDSLFPYITNPLMGHTWNSYYYHHVKHHHVEGNGPDDLSSTVRYQRDELSDFLCYLGRFLFLVWFELPSYFFRKGQVLQGLKAASWEIGNYLFIYGMYRFVNAHATLFVFILPLFLLRLGLMIGNWGQHAFVDETDPNSDFRSSITLIDVPSNRFCFNDGYHTSHHLNPRRHWREHPVAFLKQKDRYASEHALVFRNIDYLMITYRLIRKDYTHLAKCLVPIGDQISMSIEERAAMLQSKTRRFTEAEIARKFGVSR